MTKPFAVSDNTFEKDVLDSDQAVLVDFWAEWCGPCRMIAPIVEEIAKDYDGKIKVAKLDTDANPNVVQTFRVMGIPTLILFKGGQAVERITGYMPKERVLEKLTPYIS